MAKKKRILFILPSLVGGGAERITCNLINCLDKSKFSCGLFLYEYKGEYFDLIGDDIPIYFANKNGQLSYLKVFINLYKIAKEYDILVGAMELMPTYFVAFIAKLLNKNAIGWVHINMDSLLNEKKVIVRNLHKHVLIKYFYNKLDNIITVSNGAADNIKNYVVGAKHKVRCIYNPIDLEDIKNKAYEEISKTIKRPLIIAVGRLEKQKNFQLLLNMWRLYLNRGNTGELIILGEGSLREELEKIMHDLNIEDSVNLYRFEKNPYKFMRCADVYVLSSNFEGLPTVLIEALTVGTPVISMDCPDGANEILDGGKYGILVKDYDAESLCDAVEQMLNNDEMRESFIKKAKQGIDRFDKIKCTKEFEEVFLSLDK